MDSMKYFVQFPKGYKTNYLPYLSIYQPQLYEYKEMIILC